MALAAVPSCAFGVSWAGPVRYREAGREGVVRAVYVHGLSFSVVAMTPYANVPEGLFQRLIIITKELVNPLIGRVSALSITPEQMTRVSCVMEVFWDNVDTPELVDYSPVIVPEIVEHGALYRLVMTVGGVYFARDPGDGLSAAGLFPFHYREYIEIQRAAYPNRPLTIVFPVPPPPQNLRNIQNSALWDALAWACVSYQFHKDGLTNALRMNAINVIPPLLAAIWEFGFLTVYYGEALADRFLPEAHGT